MSHDSSNIDNAIVAMLGADATLLSASPNGVYFDVAPEHSTRFVIVSLLESNDESVFGGRAYEEYLYLVKAVQRSTEPNTIKAAAARIDVLLDDQPLGVGSPLSVAGYTFMACFRESRIRQTEVDPNDASILWHHRGGLYRVQMCVNP